MSPSDLAGALLLATEQLAAAVERETECLRGARFDELADCREQKQKLVGAYEAQLVGYRALPGVQTDLDAVTREALMQATRRLRGATTLNARAIEAAQRMSTQILHAITNAVAAEQQPQGYRRVAQPRRSSSAVCLSLDQRL